MTLARPAFAVLFSVALAGPLAAQDSGNFVVRLGRDTTGVEHYTRTASHIEINQVGRAPRVLQRHFVFDLSPSGATTRASATVTAPGTPAGAPPVQQVDATFTSDSMMMEIRRDTTVQRIRIACPSGALVLSNTSPWAMYEAQLMRLASQKSDSLRAPLYFLGAQTMSWVTVRKLGRDSMVIETEYDLYHASVDRDGRILNVVPLRGTSKFSADRVANLDLQAMTAGFAASEKQAGAMGMLSPRDTVRASNAGGATLWIDYGRPSKRGRTVFGGVVPWGEVWRTGANAATQFRTDKALEMAGVTVPAGFYTLWTVPSPSGWKLVINGETGQWGTQHKAEKDLYTINMSASTLPQSVERFTISIASGAQGGLVNFDWDTTRASVPFTVKP